MSRSRSCGHSGRWLFLALPLLLGLSPSVAKCAKADETAAPAESRLRPSGLEGAVILDTSDKPSEGAVARFARHLGNDKCVVAIVGEGTSEGLIDLLLTKDVKNVEVIKFADAAAASAPGVVEQLKKAKGIWLVAGDEPSKTKEILASLSPVLVETRLRGGVVAGSKSAAWILAAKYLGSEGKVHDGINVLPGMLLGRAAPTVGNAVTLDSALGQLPGMIGVRMEEKSALLLSGRDIRSLSPGKVSLLLPRSATRDARTIDVSSNRPTDYNEVRRAAAGRMQATPYPPKEVTAPEVPKGSLVIVGGGGMSAEIAKRFVELGGGEKGTFIVLPISNPDPIPANTGDGFMKRFGAKDVHIIKAREQKDLETPENLAALKRATAVWFGGGRQWRFVDAYEGTQIPELFRDVLRRGGVIGGSSAGATIQGDYLCRGAPGGPNNIICEGYEQGLRFLPGVAIDQHFTQRNRFKDMTLLMKTYPQFLGIGLDEATAIVVQGQVAEIMGPNQVHFYDRRKPVEAGKPDHDSFKAGNRYDLKERKLLGGKESK